MASCFEYLAPSLWHCFEGCRAFKRWGLAGGEKAVEISLEKSDFWVLLSVFFLNHDQVKPLTTFSCGQKDTPWCLPCYNISLRHDLNPLSINGFCQVFDYCSANVANT